LLAVAIVYSRAENQQVALNVSAGQASLAANPELALARRYAEIKIAADSAHLAANPELSLARRFAEDMEIRNELEYLASNPEAALARRIMPTQPRNEPTDRLLISR
jgi:hypothetical protein